MDMSFDFEDQKTTLASEITINSSAWTDVTKFSSIEDTTAKAERDPVQKKRCCKLIRGIHRFLHLVKATIKGKKRPKSTPKTEASQADSDISAVTNASTCELTSDRDEMRDKNPIYSANGYQSKPIKSSGVVTNPPPPASSPFSPFSTNSLEHSIASFRAASIRRSGHSHIKLLDESWEDWLEKYQRGDRNLSEIGRPTSFSGFGHIAAPLYRLETKRLRAVDKVKDPTLWASELEWVSTELISASSRHRSKAATVSIMEKTTQNSMWQTGMGHHFQQVSRDLSLDAHTLLSRDYFALLDCSNDWRTRSNPLVHGPPFIKFYLGVNIFVDQVPVGCIAVCDPYLKCRVNPELLSQSKQIATKLGQSSETNIVHKLSRQSRIQWNEKLPASPNFDTSGFSMKSFDSESSSTVSMGCEPGQEATIASEKRINDRARVARNTTVAEVTTSPSKPRSPVPHVLIFPDLGVNCFSATSSPISCQSVLQPFEVFDSSLRCQSITQAVKKACRLIKQNLGAEITYLAETRMEWAITGGGDIDVDNIDVGSLGPMNSKSSSAGNCKPSITVDLTEIVASQEQSIAAAIQSQYGIQFTREPTALDPSSSGMFSPSRRKEPSVFTRGTAKSSRTGGFVIGISHNQPQRFFSPGDQAFAKKVVRASENISTSYDEVCNVDVSNIDKS